MPYVSPGAAFSGGVEGYLMQQAALEHQQQTDQLAVQRENRDAQAQQEELANAREAMRLRRMEAELGANEKERIETQKAVDSLVPGDIPDPNLVAKAKKHNIPLRTSVKPSAPESIPGNESGGGGLAAVPVGQEQVGAIPTRTGPAVYVGGRADLEAKATRERMLALANGMEDGPEKQAMQYYASSITAENPRGTNAPPGSFPKKEAGGLKDIPLYRQHPSTGAVEQWDTVNSQWQPLHGAPQSQGHWMTPPVPKDTTAHDDREANVRATQLQHAYDAAMSEIKDVAREPKGHLDALSELGGLLDAHSPQADTLIAPILLKATVSGQGSGFRMTRAEIDNVLHGRSKWEDLQAALQKWSTDPSKANQLTEDQRTQIRELAARLYQKAHDAYGKILSTRDQLDAATSPEQIKKLRTQLQRDLDIGNTTGRKQIRYDMNGNPIKE